MSYEEGSREMHASGGCGTHVPMLAACLALEPVGPVIELGCGWWSTLMLHTMCEAQKRELLSTDVDSQWLTRFEMLRTPWHKLDLVSDWTAYEPIELDWAIALVDQSPAGDRGKTLTRLANRARLIVVHDSDSPEPYGYEPILSQFKYRYDYKVIWPHTTVVSNFRTLPW